MALPKIAYKDTSSPFKLTGGVKKDITVNVTPRAIGKCKVRLFMEAASCKFDNGTSEMNQEVQATSDTELLECVFSVKITCSQATSYIFALNAEATNSEGKKMDCAKSTIVDCSVPPPAEPDPVPNPDNVS